MIKKSTPLSATEALEYIKDSEVKAFVKKFTNLKAVDAGKLRKAIEELNLVKLNDKYISKIIDFLPEDKEELLRVLNEANLDENEAEAILLKIKEYK